MISTRPWPWDTFMSWPGFSIESWPTRDSAKTRRRRPFWRKGADRLLESGKILGLFQETPAEYFAGQRKRFLQAKGLPEEEILDLIAPERRSPPGQGLGAGG